MRSFSGIFILLIIFSSGEAGAQSYIRGGNTRHRFAQFTPGLDATYTPGGSSYYTDAAGNIHPVNIPAQQGAAIHIGGTHFWGHTEFYFNLPVLSHQPEAPEGVSWRYRQAEIFGTKIYPWRIRQKRLRPFIGSAVSYYSFSQETERPQGNGPELTRLIFPALGGITYLRGPLLWEIGARYNYHNRLHYPLDRLQSADIHLPAFSFWLGCRLMMDVTLPSEYNLKNGNTQRWYHRLKEQGRLSSYYLSAGPSAAFFTRRSAYNAQLKPYLGQHLIANVFFELSAGYFYQPWGSHLNVAWRSYSSLQSAYGAEQRISRRGLAVEVHKYIGDYHGFCPFIGPSVSFDRFELRQTDIDAAALSRRLYHASPGIVLGWDILPDKLQYFVLRTSLRYYPVIDLKMKGTPALALDQFEFNFIQLLIYPQRWKHIMKEISTDNN